MERRPIFDFYTVQIIIFCESSKRVRKVSTDGAVSCNGLVEALSTSKCVGNVPGDVFMNLERRRSLKRSWLVW